MAGQHITTLSTSEADQQAPTAPAAQPSVTPATPKQAAAQSPTAATCITTLLNRCKYNCNDVTG